MKSERIDRAISRSSPIILTMLLAKQLKVLLRANDMTVAQLARKTNVSAKTIYNWLAGQGPKDIGAVKKVADHFGVTLDFLCYGIEPPNKTEIERHFDEINTGIFEVVLRRVKR